ncbi:MAG: hypothetical protein GPJ54_06155 [Candidatus Heimdallarchaeota archaeon]|nr:hypothetical protein [Candidatus Heimdallarchaeota archaeon]
MMPLTNFDIFFLIVILVKLTMVTHFIRYVISFILPEEFRDYFDNYVRAVRNHSIDYTDKYFPNTKNFEVVMLSRIFIPLLFMMSINTYLDFLLVSYIFGRYLFLSYFFYIVKLYFFLNLAPNMDDLEILYNTTGTSRLIFFLKVLAIFSNYANLTPLYISLILVFPVSDIFDINNYRTKEIMEQHPSWNFS